MKRRGLWTVFCLLAMISSGAADSDDNKMSTGDAKTDEIMVSLQEKARDAEGCTARLSTVFRVVDPETEEILEIQEQVDATYQAPNLMRLDTEVDGKKVSTLLADSGTLWLYDPAEKIVTKFNRGRIYRETQLEIDAYVPDPLRPFRGVVWKTIRYVGDEAPDGQTLRFFEADLMPNLLNAQLPSPPVKARFAVSAKDGLLRTFRALDASGAEVVVRQFENMTVNPKLDDKLFEFVIPAGAHVMDGTQDAILLLK